MARETLKRSTSNEDCAEVREDSITSLKRDELEDFRLQCERNLARSVEARMRYGFCYVYKPVLDDADWRSFSSTAEYRRWCRDNLPDYLGYGEMDALRRELDEGQQL
ncbi:MAG TPA: hypothetical protein VKB86_07280 [Pyrinomonadaceae bacterium]|nr:hypothetical protein [Pyrinomonadaceae bacterium]